MHFIHHYKNEKLCTRFAKHQNEMLYLANDNKDYIQVCATSLELNLTLILVDIEYLIAVTK